MKIRKSQGTPFPLTAMHGLYSYIYCMMASSILVDMPIFGGALFMCWQVTMVFINTYAGQTKPYLPKIARRWQIALLVLLLLMNLFLVVLYPITLDNPKMWMLFFLVLLMMARDESTRLLIRLNGVGRLDNRRLYLAEAAKQALLLGAAAGTFLYNVGGIPGWKMLGGYALCSAMECYSQFKERAKLPAHEAVEPSVASEMAAKLRTANAYRTYEAVAALILAALVMTLIVMYTFLTATAEAVLRCMILAGVVMILSREGAELLLRRREKRRAVDPTNLLLVGLAVWLCGLVFFSDMLREQQANMSSTYIYMGLCTVGATLCLTCLGRMEQVMEQVARFTARSETPGLARMRTAMRQLALLLGEMLALVALTALCFLSGKDLPRDMNQIAARFQPVMVLPALLTVLAAVLSVLRFPLTGRWQGKLSRFLRLREEGGENPALEKQLESVVVKRHRPPLGTRIIIALLRPLFKHELKGTENIVTDDNNPLVFLCNHGEIYGPVVCMLYIPVPIRPWVMSELNIHKDEVAAYIYKHTISKIEWLGPLRWPLAKLIGPVSVWCMQQLESIPVFRNKPRELMNTFRTSVEAMQAGDNLLIFPENPDADRDNPGYEHDKGAMGELFRGFAMLAQVYYNRTGKRCRFLPMYAHKGLRTLNFGTVIEYDPDNDPMAERDRIVDGTYEQMLALAAREDALYNARKKAE